MTADATKIKICGVTRIADALVCAEAGAGYLGFVFHPDSPRAITPVRARRMVDLLPPGTIPVGVFVNPEPDELRKAIDASGVRMVQLCGDEPPETCRSAQVPVIKVLRAGSAAGMSAEEMSAETLSAKASRYDVFAYMLEGAPEGSYGGTGTLPDLSLATGLAAKVKLFIAGGLTAGNVAGIIAAVQPFGVDVCSGTELVPRVKDHFKVVSFCREAQLSTEKPCLS